MTAARFSIALPLAALLVLAAGSPAAAQRVVAYDTLSAMTAGAAECGFCAGEKYGVVFYELPGGGGLAPSEFPLILRAVRIAVARVTVTGPTTCMGSGAGGTEPFDIAVYAGTTVPTDIASLPTSGPWPGETELLSVPANPLETSIVTSGMGAFEATFNEVPLVDEMGEPFMVDAPATYLRVVIGIQAGGSSTSCASPLMPPAGVPLRDDDGRIDAHRGFILAAGGVGSRWFWNEDVPGGGIGGDWALRLVLTPLGMGADGGGVSLDAGGATADAGARDAGSDARVASDAGTAVPDAGAGAPGDDGGCGCRVAGDAQPRAASGTLYATGGLGVTMFIVLAMRRARRRRTTARPSP